MYGKPRGDQRAVERLLVLALLRRDHDERWSQAELQAELATASRRTIKAALGGLVSNRVACTDAGQAWASPATRTLNDLDMICI